MKCHGKTKSGGACKMPPLKGSKYCFTHNPATRTAQALARKIGGHNSATPHAGNVETITASPRTIPEAMTILDYAKAEILVLDNSIPRGRLLVSLAAAYVDALKVGELEAQLKELLAVLASRKEA
jgi:hypothetical protein